MVCLSFLLFCSVNFFFFCSFLDGDRHALIEKLISEVMILIACYLQPVRNLVCRLSELFE